MHIRAITDNDKPAVRTFFDEAADYVHLETGQAPSDKTVDDFYADHPPQKTIADTAKFGAFVGDRIFGLLDLGFGYPKDDDVYIAYLVIVSDQRGSGLGVDLLRHAKKVAADRGAKNLYLAVLDKNTKGRAFWEREGFQVVLTVPPDPSDQMQHIRHRMLLKL